MANVAMRQGRQEWRRIFQGQQPIIINARCYFLKEMSLPASHHAILVFIIPVLIDFVEVKFQRGNQSPFEAYPVTTMVAVTSLLAYCFVYGAVLAFSSSKHLHACHILMTFCGSLSVASLTSILLPESMQSIVYALYILLSMGEFKGIIQQIYKRIHQRIMQMVYHIPHVRECHAQSRPLLPLTFMDAHYIHES